MQISDEDRAREIVRYISAAAIELAFTRHELTTTGYEAEEHADIEEGVESFKSLVEEVKADVLACLTGDETGCLDPEDVDYDNETQRTIRILSAARAEQKEKALNAAIEIIANVKLDPQLNGHYHNGCAMTQFLAIEALEAAKADEQNRG